MIKLVDPETKRGNDRAEAGGNRWVRVWNKADIIRLEFRQSLCSDITEQSSLKCVWNTERKPLKSKLHFGPINVEKLQLLPPPSLASRATAQAFIMHGTKNKHPPNFCFVDTHSVAQLKTRQVWNRSSNERVRFYCLFTLIYGGDQTGLSTAQVKHQDVSLVFLWHNVFYDGCCHCVALASNMDSAKHTYTW